MYLVLALYAMFASVFTIAKTGLEYTYPFFFVGSRMVLAGIILLAYQFIFHRDGFKLKRETIWPLTLLALFNIYLTNTFEFWGLQYLTSVKACFIYSLSPFVSALFSYFIFAERLNWKKWLGLTVGCAGLLPILLSSTEYESETGYFFMFSWAEVAVMAAAVCSVYGWILLRKVVKDGECSPVMANGLSMLLGGGFALLHSSFVEPWNPIPATEYLPYLECTILLIVISNLICYNLYGLLLKKFSATFMSFAGFTTPIFTAIFGWLYLGEVITWQYYLSFAIVLPGLAIFYQEELEKDYRISAKTALAETA